MSMPEATKVPSRFSTIQHESDNGGPSDQNEEPDVPEVKVAEESAGETVEWKPTRAFLLAMSALCALVLGVSIDSTSLSVALPTMSIALGGTALEAFWSGTSFLLSSTVLQPSVASLSNIIGRKNAIFLAIGFFAAGSLIAALANTYTVVLAGRVIQGLGGGSLLSLTEVVITDIVPLKYRASWLSLFAAMSSIGTVTGPIIGAGFAQNVSWRWIFYINLPLIGVGAVMVVLFLHQKRLPGNMLTKLKSFDWLGSFLFTAGSTVFLFGISVGGVMYDWSSWRTLLPLILGPIIIAVFGVWEARYAAEPIINREIFNKWTLISTYIQTIIHGIILWSLLFFMVLYYQAVQSYSTVISAVAILPETLTVAPSAVVVGVIAGMTLRYRWALWTGWALTTLGAGLLYLLNPGTSIPAWIFLNLPIGLGTGMLFSAMALSIQASTEPRLNGQAAAFFAFLRTFGQSIGVAISGVIFQNAFRQKLEALPAFALLADDYSRDATIVVGLIQAMPDGQDKADLMQAYADGLKVLWLALLAVAAVGLLLSLSNKEYSLDQEHVTSQGLRDSKEIERSGGDEEAGFASEK